MSISLRPSGGPGGRHPQTLAGVAMYFLPGPGVPVLMIGLSLLITGLVLAAAGRRSHRTPRPSKPIDGYTDRACRAGWFARLPNVDGNSRIQRYVECADVWHTLRHPRTFP